MLYLLCKQVYEGKHSLSMFFETDFSVKFVECIFCIYMTAGIHCFYPGNFSLQNVLLLLCLIPVWYMPVVFPLHESCLPSAIL